jgi:hypothetical protein
MASSGMLRKIGGYQLQSILLIGRENEISQVLFSKMKYVFGIIVTLHGLIHLLGFVKGFDLKEVKELTLPISKPRGVVWLIAAIVIIAYCVLFFASSKYSWLLGFFAVIVSQCLIILYWSDAKFGTLPNIAILIVSISSYGNYNFQKLVQHETANLLGQITAAGVRVISEKDLVGLPKPVVKWFHRSDAVDNPYIYLGKVTQKAEMKMKPDQDNWLEANAVQYTSIDEPAFIWTVDVKMNSLINFQGRDKFEGGKGEMLIKLNSLFNIVDEKGPKLDEGTLQRFLGEMVWFPSLALSPFITWQEIDEFTATATMNYNGTTGSGTFYFNSDGDFVKFSAMRYRGNEPEAQRYEWVLLVDAYKTFEGIKVPSKMTATWKLDNEDWTWLKLEVEDIKYNGNALP